MGYYSVANFTESELPTKTLEKYYKDCKKAILSEKEYSKIKFSDLDIIFKVACDNRLLFTAKNIGKKAENKEKEYLYRWMISYCKAINNPPSQKEASPKASCGDPLIVTMLKISKNIDNDTAASLISAHNFCMSAENVLGALLEEYIAKKIHSYGWVWCAGETLKAIDFCNTTGTVLLQIKNKFNSENSSSKDVRKGTSIEKWYRLGTSSTKWEELNEIINNNRPKGKKEINLTEESFKKFVSSVVKKNLDIITEK